MTNKNQKLLDEFNTYCEKNPDMRFWQALCNWSGAENVYLASREERVLIDTFYLDGKPNFPDLS